MIALASRECVDEVGGADDVDEVAWAMVGPYLERDEQQLKGDGCCGAIGVGVVCAVCTGLVVVVLWWWCVVVWVTREVVCRLVCDDGHNWMHHGRVVGCVLSWQIVHQNIGEEQNDANSKRL